MKSMQLHEGAIFATSKEGKWLFTGGWNKTVNVQVSMQNRIIKPYFIFILIRF